MPTDTYKDYDETLGHDKRKTAVGTSAGAGDAGKIAALGPDGRWDPSMMPAGFGDEPADMVADGAISQGDLVSVYDDAGPKMRRADGSTTGKECHGWATESLADGETGGVLFDGINTYQTGLTPGPVYLSQTVPGQATSVKPTLAGIAQRVGTANATSSFAFEAQDPTGL